MNAMWEFVRFASRRRKNLARKLVFYAATTVLVAFLCVVTISTDTFAENAFWNNSSSVSYEGNTYKGPAETTLVKNLGLPEKSKVFTFIDKSSSTDKNVMHVIYYESTGDNTSIGTDSDSAKQAKYKTYIQNSSKDYSESTPATGITIDKASDHPNDTEEIETCKVEGGLGWIICPVTEILAKTVDTIYGYVTGFLKVRPIETSRDNPLYKAWSYMQSVANVVFVIVFLVIIYSQLTNYKLDSYGLKKILPKLIVVAILVNISYYICSILVDISNIIGYSINDVLLGVRNDLIDVKEGNWSLMNFESIMSFVLSGGTVVAAGAVWIATTFATYFLPGVLWMLVPMLLTLLLSVLVTLIVLAARQALIVILVVISPLAFVAYILPNTEGWFEKWKDTLLTMLIMFPAFSLLFGGSQLAGWLIIQNADSILMVVLGMFVQVMPLAITPFLLKISGNLLSKVAGIIDNPNKGIIDRARKLSEERAEDHAAKRLSTDAKPHQFLKKYAQFRDFDRRRRETRRKVHSNMADNRFNATQAAEELYEANYNTEVEKRTIEGRQERNLHRKINSNREMLQREMESKVVADEATYHKSVIERRHEELRAGHDTTNGDLAHFTRRAQDATLNISIDGLAKESAKRIQQSNTERALAPPAVSVNGLMEIPRTMEAEYAAGIDGEKGVLRIQAHAKGQSDKRFSEDVNTMVTLMSSKTNTANKMNDSRAWLEQAVNAIPADDAETESFIIRAFAATQLLLQTGAPGKVKLHEFIETIQAGDNRPQVAKLKSYLLSNGINESDIIIDKWACNGQNLSIQQVAANPATYLGLNPESLAGQTNFVMRQAYIANAISQKTAKELLENPQAARKLSPGARLFFEAIRDGVTPPPTPSDKSAP